MPRAACGSVEHAPPAAVRASEDDSEENRESMAPDEAGASANGPYFNLRVSNVIDGCSSRLAEQKATR